LHMCHTLTLATTSSAQVAARDRRNFPKMASNTISASFSMRHIRLDCSVQGRRCLPLPFALTKKNKHPGYFPLRGSRGRSTAVVYASAKNSTQGTAQEPNSGNDMEEIISDANGKVIKEPLYGLVTLLSGIGVAETSYLTFLKLSNTAPGICKASGGCADVLSSQWSEIAGVPLPFLGLLTYGAMLVLAGQGGLAVKTAADRTQTAQDQALAAERCESLRAGMQGMATVAAGTSLYLMLTLFFKLEGQSCLFCYISATLSSLILVSTLPGWRAKDVPSGAGVLLAVVLGLGYGFGDLDKPTIYNEKAQARASQAEEINLVYKEPVVDTVSNPEDVRLARHLKETGAKFYGAFWCSHCLDQKLQFGREAYTELPYVECFPDGWRRGTPIDSQCKAANVQGFPTWVIDGKIYEGDRTFEELAKASGYKASN